MFGWIIAKDIKTGAYYANRGLQTMEDLKRRFEDENYEFILFMQVDAESSFQEDCKLLVKIALVMGIETIQGLEPEFAKNQQQQSKE